MDAELADVEQIANRVAAALKDPVRIQLTSSLRPLAVNGHHIKHTIFGEQTTPGHYENVRERRSISTW